MVTQHLQSPPAPPKSHFKDTKGKIKDAALGIRKSYISPPAKLWNVAHKFCRSKKLAPEFHADSITEAALRAANQESFNDDSFCIPLKNLFHSLNKNNAFHAFGKHYLYQVFLGLLKNRFELEGYWKANPQVLSEKIKRPLIIIGLPRTGSSHLVNLLSQDTTHRCLTNWEAVLSQTPPPGNYTFETDPRRKMGKRLIHLQKIIAPQMTAMHTFYLDGPEECTPLLMQSFSTSVFGINLNVPEFTDWQKSTPRLPMYLHHQRILQTLQWKYPADRWLLKAPLHLESLEELVQVYPDACIIQTHRDPAKVVPSTASLAGAFRGISSPTLDYQKLGKQTLDNLTNLVQCGMEQRKRNTNINILDIHYSDLINDPLGTVRKVYTHFKIPYSDQTQNNIFGYLKRDRKQKKSPHQYCVEEFGLTTNQIHSSFADYIENYKCPLES